MGKVIKSYIHVIIALLIGIVCLLFIPSANGLTELGVKVLAVFSRYCICG